MFISISNFCNSKPDGRALNFNHFIFVLLKFYNSPNIV